MRRSHFFRWARLLAHSLVTLDYTHYLLPLLHHYFLSVLSRRFEAPPSTADAQKHASSASICTHTTMPRRIPLNHEQHEDAKTKFLASFRVSGNVKDSAQAAGVGRDTIYRWRNDEPEFAARFADAEDDAADVLRAEIKRRAVDGYDEVQTVTDGEGNVKTVTTTRKHSDAILRLLAQARLPEYKPQLDITSGNAPLMENLAISIETKAVTDAAADLLRLISGANSGETETGGTGVYHDAG